MDTVDREGGVAEQLLRGEEQDRPGGRCDARERDEEGGEAVQERGREERRAATKPHERSGLRGEEQAGVSRVFFSKRKPKVWPGFSGPRLHRIRIKLLIFRLSCVSITPPAWIHL